MIPRSKVRLESLFPELGLVGDASAHGGLVVTGIAQANKAGPGDLVFLAQDRLLPYLSTATPLAFVVSDALWAQAESFSPQVPVLRSRDAMLAFAKVSRHFSGEVTPVAGIHPSAIVHPGAILGKGVSVGPGVEIAEGAEIGDGVVLHGRVQVGARSVVGAQSELFAGVVLYHDVTIGARVRVHANTVIGSDGFGYVQEKTDRGVRHVKIHHLGGVRIGDDVEIGASTTIDRGTLGDTVIERGSIIDNQVHIGHNCHLEEGVILCGCVGLAGSVHIEKFAVVAGMCGITNKVRIGAGAQVGGMSAVIGNVPPGVKWGGVPATKLMDYTRMQVYLRRLPELFERRKKEKHG